jgi:Flp pilus assembly protein TadD
MLLLVFLTFSLLGRATSGGAGQDSDKAQQHARRGLNLAGAGDLKAAESELRQAAELAPTRATYLADLGMILGMQQRFKEAGTYFKRALKLDPGNLTVRRNLAVAQWHLNQLREAKKNLEFILLAKPGDQSAIRLLGMVAERTKDYATASKLLSLTSPLKTSPAGK